MQKQMSYKKVIIGIGAAAAVIAAVVAVLLLNKEETFRSIMVYEVDGTVTIERESVGSMNAAQNLYLESGDRVSVAQESSMRMKLDDDKYVMAEADTIFAVEAEGTDNDSKTRICLEQGAITNEIQHPLSEGSQYETSTPNSVMAVRGTIYRVELYVDENGDRNTKMSCFQGKVGATPILPDGTLGEEVLVPAGSELVIYSDGTVGVPRDIVYEELPAQALQGLKSMLENGQSMEGIALEDMSELVDKVNKTSNVSEESEVREPEQTTPTDTEEDSGQDNTDADSDLDTTKSASVQTGKDTKVSGTSKVTEQPEEKPQTTNEQKPKVSEQVSNDSANSGTENDSSQSGNGGNSSGNDNKQESRPDDHKPGGGSNNHTPVIPPQPATYTVTFEYDGKTFATQTVKSGEKAVEPKLIPEVSGDWDFDFTTGITANTTIKWKQ